MKKQLPVRVEETIQKKLKELAKLDRRSFSNYVNMVLEIHVEEKLQKRR